MTYNLNEKGKEFKLKSKKELNIYLITGPMFVSVITLLFLIGSKNHAHLYFSIFLSILLCLYIILGFVFITKRLSKTIDLVSISSDKIYLQTISILFYKSKHFQISLKDFRYYEKEMIIKKTNKLIWQIPLDNIQLYLIKDFFQNELFENIKKTID
jgi:hypothetical protein